MDLVRWGWLYVSSSAAPWVVDRYERALVHWRTFSRSYRWLVLGVTAGGTVLYLVSLYHLEREARRVPLQLRALSDAGDAATDGPLDAIVVGGGPAGCACAFFLASAGGRVLLLERDAYPRDKICGMLHGRVAGAGGWFDDGVR